MNRLIFAAFAIALATPCAAQQWEKKATTDVDAYIRIVDEIDGTAETGVTAATAGLDLEWTRAGEAPVNITEIDLAAAGSAHADGGLKWIAGDLYRVCLPDAACATGTPDFVIVSGTVTGMRVLGTRIQLTAVDAQNAVDFGMSAIAAIQAAIDALEPVVTVPVDQVPVPEERTWRPTRGPNGLIAAVAIGMKVGEPDVPFAIDFRHDLANNGRLIDFDSIVIQTGTAGGVTFDADLGVDKVQAKCKITAVTAGTYYLKATVSRDPSDGGGKSIAIVRVIVTE